MLCVFMHVVCVTCAETCGAVSGIEMDRFSYISIEKIFFTDRLFNLQRYSHEHGQFHPQCHSQLRLHIYNYSYIFTYTQTDTST